MAQVKICPQCGAENPADAFICENCIISLAEVLPVDKSSANPPENHNKPHENTSCSSAADDSTIIASQNISFMTENGCLAFVCKNGDLVGRQHIGSEFLADKKTVSRKHCRIRHGVNGWEIEDCGSVNGTWLNGVRVADSSPLADGDHVQLSLSCNLRVKL